MKSFLIIALAVLATSSLSAADLAGTWKGSMETQMGTSTVTIVVQPGAALAGTAYLGEYEGKIEKAVVDGDKIAFEVNISPGKLIFKGTVAGDEMKLNVVGTQGDNYVLVCKRQK